jgi:hypothetical protein
VAALAALVTAAVGDFIREVAANRDAVGGR